MKDREQFGKKKLVDVYCNSAIRLFLYIQRKKWNSGVGRDVCKFWLDLQLLNVSYGNSPHKIDLVFVDDKMKNGTATIGQYYWLVG